MFKIGVQFAAATIACLVLLVGQGWAGQQTQIGQTSTEQASQPTSFVDRTLEMNYAEIQLAHLAMMQAQDSRVKDFAVMVVRDHTQAVSRLQGTQPTQALNDVQSIDQIIAQLQKDADAAQDPADVQGGIRQKSTTTIPNTDDRKMLTRDHQQILDRLSMVSGPQFDRDFMDAMVREHRTAVRLFEQEARDQSQTATQPNNPDPQVAGDSAAIAREMLPSIRQHLAEAEQIQHQLQATNIR